MKSFELPLQPGEVSAEMHRRGHGPPSEMRDGALHPAVKVEAGGLAVKHAASTPVPEQPDHTYSGPTFDYIAFSD